MVSFDILSDCVVGEITETNVKLLDVTLLDQLLRCVAKAQEMDTGFRMRSRYRVVVDDCVIVSPGLNESAQPTPRDSQGLYADMPGPGPNESAQLVPRASQDLYADMPGLVREWHVNIRPYKSRNRAYWDGTDGYCYLGVITARHRPLVAKALGKWPTVEQLLTLDVQYIGASSIVDEHDAYVSGGEGVVLRDLLVTAARKRVARPWPERSYGEALARSKYQVEEPVEVSLLDVMGGVSALGGKKLHGLPRKNPSRSYRYAEPYRYKFPVTVEDARSILATAKSRWDVEHVSDLSVLSALVPLLCYTTSPKTDFGAATFSVDGRDLSLQELSDAAKSVVGKDNSLRLWVKSYERGMLCVAMASYLRYFDSSAPAQWNAIAYSASDWNVRYAFDCAHILRHALSPTFLLQRGLRTVKRLKFRPPA